MVGGGGGRPRVDASPLGGPFALGGWLAFIIVSLALALFARGGMWLNPPRVLVDDLTAPGRALAAAPFVAVRDVLRGFGGHWRVHAENERLRQENRELREWYDLAQALLNKTERYEELLAFNPEPDTVSVAGRVVGETSGPFVRARLVNVGSNDGVEPGLAVMSDRGLVGRVVASGRHASRVLLLTDLNSRIPVMVERTNDRAILSGDNTASPRLDFLAQRSSLVVGDRIVTSGDGGDFPRGLIVGEAKADGDGWRAYLFADDAPIDYVRVLRFDFPPSPENEPPILEEGGGSTVVRATGGAG